MPITTSRQGAYLDYGVSIKYIQIIRTANKQHRLPRHECHRHFDHGELTDNRRDIVCSVEEGAVEVTMRGGNHDAPEENAADDGAVDGSARCVDDEEDDENDDERRDPEEDDQ